MTKQNPKVAAPPKNAMPRGLFTRAAGFVGLGNSLMAASVVAVASGSMILAPGPFFTGEDADSGQAAAADLVPIVNYPSKEMRTPPVIQTTELGSIFFRAGQVQPAREQVAQLSFDARTRACDEIYIAAYSSQDGATDWNQKLSGKRAKNAKEAFIRAGFPSEDIIAVGMGETDHFGPSAHQNRRAELLCQTSQAGLRMADINQPPTPRPFGQAGFSGPALSPDRSR